MSKFRTRSSKTLLLSGASFAAVLLMAPAAHATTFTGMTGKMTSQVPNTVATKPVTSGAGPNSPNLQPGAQSQSSMDFSSALARIQAQLSSQAAARSAAVNLPSNVPDGLAPGGLNPVANPKPAAQDTTGLLTWDGASAPTQTNDASGNANVTIHQTQTRAILSWQSFNVGKNTTLNFDQQGNADWVALNRVVGADTTPSQILGNIKADGTVLVINQNGILFGGSSQINVHSLIATTLDVGNVVDESLNPPGTVRTIQQRNQTFLDQGFLGSADATPGVPGVGGALAFSSSSAVKTGNTITYGAVPGTVTVEDGAEIASGDSGYILLAGPTVQNAGHLSSVHGQVILAGGDEIDLNRATGATGDGLRGVSVQVLNRRTGVSEGVLNDTDGLIEAPEGSVILSAANIAVNRGVLSTTTSVSRNGVIQISAPNVQLAPGSTIAITPDPDGGSLPQDADSLSNFNPSEIDIGNLFSQSPTQSAIGALIDVGAGSLTFAPSGNINIGGTSSGILSIPQTGTSRVFVDGGAIIDAAGLTDIQVPASRNLITISPLKKNELADDPAYKNSFLNGATVYVDPRLSGVRDDGVAWIGSPLIDAASYYQQVGLSVQELMTKGGNIVLGATSYKAGTPVKDTGDIVVKSGASLNIAGGWVTYQAGKIQTTKLITADGRVVDIGSADINDDFVGIYNGYVVNHPRWALHDTYTNSLIFGAYYAPSYSEGRDAGSLTLQTSSLVFDGALAAGVYDGPMQLALAETGTLAGTIYGDERLLQAAPAQLPTGGMLFIQSQGQAGAASGPIPISSGGGDVVIQSASTYQALPDDLAYGQILQTAADGSLALSVRDPASYRTDDQIGTIRLSDAMLSNVGLAQLSLSASGAVTINKDAHIALAAGGILDVLAGHKITIDGTVSVPSGTISLATYSGGSVFAPTATPQVGDYDVVINGTLSAAGRWVNDTALATSDMEGAAWLDGGSIALYAAPRIATTTSGTSVDTSTDLSGSILINAGSTIDVSGGGRVDRLGRLDLSAKGGNLSLYDETSFYQLGEAANFGDLGGGQSGFRVSGLMLLQDGAPPTPYLPVNPDKINAHVAIAPGTIRAQGFAGGGTFILTAPEFAFGNNDGAASTELPLDFISTAGFANYNISSTKTDIIANPFDNGLGGTDAILATQVLTIGNGQNLNLTQSMLPSVLSGSQVAALRDLASGGDIFSVVSPAVPDNAWDRKAANLTLGGLLELDVAAGGSITGDAGAQLTVAKLLNEGTIRLPGGTLTQRQLMPMLYTRAGTLGIHDLSDAFTVNPDGTISEDTASKIAGLTNAQLAEQGADNSTVPHPIYFLGNLDAEQGIVLAAGSTTDLSGTSILNPYATDGLNGAVIRTGRIVGGGTLASVADTLPGQTYYQLRFGTVYQATAATFAGSDPISSLTAGQTGRILDVQSGAIVNLSGASDVYDTPAAGAGFFAHSDGYVATPVWSDAGTFAAQAGFNVAGATILAHGGAPQAEGGTLLLLDPILAQHDAVTPKANVISADMIASGGFTTLAALGSVSSSGDVTVDLGRGFFLGDRPKGSDPNQLVSSADLSSPNNYVPTLRTDGGTLTINTPYADFLSIFDEISTPALGTPGTGSVVINAGAMDVSGWLLLDRSVGNATFNVGGDLRLTGVQPWIQTLLPNQEDVVPTTLRGGIAANGDLTLIAGQIYPTTGSSFSISSAAPTGTITMERSGGSPPAAPYSAGGALTIQAANIVQDGVVRVPLGSLTLGGTAATDFAPATESLILGDGGITSVSANGLVIPYGTTTDQTEWYFAPTSADPLSAPPQKLLSLNGTDVKITQAANVDISGGGDVYAYEFVPGTGGSRDVLDQRNPDPFTSSGGYQYPDKRQVYAIVPGLSDNPVAAYDPLYSSNYGLPSPATAGQRVWLDGGKGLAAGWYTLLPAQYALLPGGMRVVEETGVQNVALGTSYRQADGALLVAGHYGDALSGASQSQERLFNIQSQAVINSESTIVQTTGNTYFAALAAHAGEITPQLPQDAGRLVINPGSTLTVDATLSTAADKGGRGAKVDIGGAQIDILSALPQAAPADGVIRIAADSLTNLNADSLLIGGTRTDNADGTTTLNVSGNDVTVENDAATPLSAGEIVLAANSAVTVKDGAAIVAVGKITDTRNGVYQIGSDSVSGAGALLRVANGPERLVVRSNSAGAANLTVGAATLSGASVGFDSSATDSLDPNLAIQNADHISIGAPRIGFGADPATYDGLVLDGALEKLLTQGGAHLTLRSQSSIDFAGGDYNFGDITFDAAALSGLDGADVAIHGGAVGLGNSGAAGLTCTECLAGNGALTIDAKSIAFTGGVIATKASALAGDVPVTIDAEITVIIPAGTVVNDSSGSFLTTAFPVPMVVPFGVGLSLGAGTGVILPGGADGTLTAGTVVTPATGGTLSLPAGGRYNLPEGLTFCFFGSCSTAAPGIYTLVNNTMAPLPEGAKVALNAPVQATLSQFFGAVTLNAPGGIYAEGKGSALDVGPAGLTVTTPYIGDHAMTLAAATNAVIPDLLLASTGAVTIGNGGAAPLTVNGIPGASITIDGQSIAISGTQLHATAGSIALNAADSIALTNSADIEAQGYVQSFGDSVDPVTQNAPGGRIKLSAAQGNIGLGDATLSVGGGAGDAGTLVLSASNGAVDFGAATLDGTGGANGAGGNFALDTQGAVDLAALNDRMGANGFTGSFAVHTTAGDLNLGAGKTLKSGAVSLTADGGLVDIAGVIDTSGINGGDITLYGRSGVTLEGTARLDASAAGYAADDTRQAKAGTVTLGTDFVSSTTNTDGSVTGTSGIIHVANGAVIDVSAKRPGDRLVPYYADNVEYYDYVQGDQGGTVVLRAPVAGGAVNVTVDTAGSIVGANAINLIGFKRWDLGAVADSLLYQGVTRVGDTVTLNVATDLDTANADGTLTSVGGVNFLGDKGGAGPQTLVDFVQGFDVSASYGNLGGLAAQANFHAQPGMDLTYAGNITLASNWNLGAGIVNQDGAIAGTAGVAAMRIDGGLNVPVVIPGQEGNLLANYTEMLYRTHGSAAGEPGALSLRAGGTLDLQSSLTDGFFQFGDQTDPTYLNTIGSASNNVTLTLNGGVSSATVAPISWAATATTTTVPSSYLDLSFLTGSNGYLATQALAQVAIAPYSALANSPAALGSFPQGTGAGTSSIDHGGDPLGSAVVFPLLPDGSVARSWAYNLTAGADLAGLSSADPARVNPVATTANLILEGTSSYSYSHSTTSNNTAVSGVNVDLNYVGFSGVPSAALGGTPLAQWLAGLLQARGNIASDSVAMITLTNNANPASVPPITPIILGLFQQMVNDKGLVANSTDPALGYKRLNTSTVVAILVMPESRFQEFITDYLVPNASAISNAYHYTPPANTSTAAVTAYTKSLVRTGTGNIGVSAGGNVDLTNGPAAERGIYLGGAPFGGSSTVFQVGGTTVYTAGHPVDVTDVVVTAPDTGADITLDLSAAVPQTSNFAKALLYNYGTGTQLTATGAPGFLIADPKYLEGGGDIAVAAGNDVLGRRDGWIPAYLGLGYNGSSTGIGAPDQPWRAGSVGMNTQIGINPQLFTDGVGALGGGNISVDAGRNISDMAAIADNSVLTATASGNTFPTLALASFGSGNVRLNAGEDLLGGRVDVASGTGTIIAGHEILDAGSYSTTQIGNNNRPLVSNLLRLRVMDATVDIVAGGDADIQGISALGTQQERGDPTSNADSFGLYSTHAGLSIVADGTVSLENQADNLQSFSGTGGGYGVYPGSLEAISLTGNLNIKTGDLQGVASTGLLLYPSATGQLTLLAAGDIAPASIAMLDADPGLLPGAFSIATYAGVGSLVTGEDFAFPSVQPNTTDAARRLLHKEVATHADDDQPVIVMAGNDIGTDDAGMILSVPKQARIDAGRDIINMMFFGQNLSPLDVTRIVAGRDITATSTRVAPTVDKANTKGAPEPTLLGNTFIIGGPGNFILEAGRDLGPFLNSASVTQYSGTTFPFAATNSIYGGGILSVGNEWNPWLPQQGASLSVLFGVAGGTQYDALREAYLDPANLAAMPDYLFEQTKEQITTGGGLTDTISVADRSKPIYGPMLVQWLQANAPALLTAAYGTTNVSYDQAYTVFAGLPELDQRAFLDKIYFNELKLTSDPMGPSYLQYARGYQVVNTLFPASNGYTQNDLTGGGNGANQPVVTGNLDLRLATIQTARGGDIAIMGPGGRVLAGSTVRTSEQAARRTYDGTILFNGLPAPWISNATTTPYAAAISAIPSGYEGVLTLRGGAIDAFTDGDFLLNQSRVFTEQGGEIVMWSSNADLNAGQGPKTSANFPPVLVKVDQDLFSELDQVGATTGAGIASLQASPDAPPSNVYLIAPRGTVDAGDAGIRVSGDFFVAALAVANADNIQVQGKSFGLPPTPVTNLTLTTASTAATEAASIANTMRTAQPTATVEVEVTGFGGEDSNNPENCVPGPGNNCAPSRR